MNNGGCRRNYVILHIIISFYYQKMVPINIPRIGKLVTRGTKEKNHRHRFHMLTDSSQIYLRKQHKNRKYRNYIIFFVGFLISDTKYTLIMWCPVITQEKTTPIMLCPSCSHKQLFDQLHIAR